MSYIGDFTPGKTVRRFFNTRGTSGAPITLGGTPAISVYKDNSTTESTSGVTLNVDLDSRTGMHHVAIDTSADGTFYSAGSDFQIVITTGTVDSISVVGVVVGTFSLSNRSALRPTTADRTLDVASTGEAGLDFDNIKQATGATTLNNIALASGALANVTAWTVNITGNLSGSVGSVTAGVTVTTNNDKTGYSLASGGLAAVTTWTVAITGNITGNLSGSVGSVTGNVGGNVVGSVASVVGAVGSVTGNVGGNVTGSVGSVVGNVGGNVTGSVGSVTGLNAALLDVAVSTRLAAGSYTSPPSASDIWTHGTRTLTAFAFSVTVGTNNDKTGYSLAVAPPTASQIWSFGTRTLTSGGGSGGATVEEITAAILPTITAGAFTSADRETLGKALTLEQFTALQK